MRDSIHFFASALLAGAMIVLQPAAAQAQTADPAMAHNEQVVRKLIEESDPDVTFLARLKMMRAHLSAAMTNVTNGELSEAREHIKHPGSEILPEIMSVLMARKLKDPSPALAAALDTLLRGNIADIRNAVAAADSDVALAEDSVDPSKITFNGILPDTAVLLLRTAVIEYAGAFKYGKIVNLVEYHDGWAFVAEATRMIESAGPEMAARDAAAYDKLSQSLAELQKAWPSDKPPEKTTVPLTKMLALVTIIELQINRMRAGF